MLHDTTWAVIQDIAYLLLIVLSIKTEKAVNAGANLYIGLDELSGQGQGFKWLDGRPVSIITLVVGLYIFSSSFHCYGS